MATALELFSVLASMLPKYFAAMAPTAWYASKTVTQEVEESVNDLVLTSLSHPSSY